MSLKFIEASTSTGKMTLNNKRQRDEDENKLVDSKRSKSQPKKVPYTKCPAKMITSFKEKLRNYISELDEMELDLKNTSLKAYETSAELRRKAQLKTEETIAELKINNGFNINDEEINLPFELQLEIETIQKNSDALIEKTDSYEQILSSDSQSNELLAEINKMKQKAMHWQNSESIKEKIELNQAKFELNDFSLNEIKLKIKFLPVNSNQMLFVEDEQMLAE